MRIFQRTLVKAAAALPAHWQSAPLPTPFCCIKTARYCLLPLAESRAPLLPPPKMLPITPEARAGLRDDSARVARLVLFWRARSLDCDAAAAAAAGGLLAGPLIEVSGLLKGLGVSPPLSMCSAAGLRQPFAAVLPASSVSRMAVMAGLMLFCRSCTTGLCLRTWSTTVYTHVF